jgi:DNA-binding protein HU-beta
LNKTELIDEVAKNVPELTKIKAGQAVDAVINAIEGALKAGDAVTLIGFGTFSIGDRVARTGRNPKTGEPMQIPASRVPRFRPGKNLKDAVTAAPVANVAEKKVAAASVSPAPAPVAKEKGKDKNKKK